MIKMKKKRKTGTRKAKKKKRKNNLPIILKSRNKKNDKKLDF